VKIKVKILSGGIKEQIMEISGDSTYEELLELLRINPEVVVVLHDGDPVPLDEKITPGDIEILRVVTGGNRYL